MTEAKWRGYPTFSGDREDYFVVLRVLGHDTVVEIWVEPPAKVTADIIGIIGPVSRTKTTVRAWDQ
jgi:hypothetical protein